MRVGQGHGCELPEAQQGDRLEARASLHHWHGEDFPSARGFKEVTKFSLCLNRPLPIWVVRMNFDCFCRPVTS